MSQAPAETISHDSKEKHAPPEKVYLVSYPKIISFFPSALIALIIGTIMVVLQNPVSGGPDDRNFRVAVILAHLFLFTFTVNLIIVGFDFPRGTSVTILFVVTSLALGAFLLFQNFDGLFPAVSRILRSINPVMNSTFYFLYFFIFALIYLAVLIKVQFDYWEIRPNELLHHHGILSDLERYPAPNLRVSKEVSDVFEYFLFRSGRLILHPSSETRAIILDNVPFIDYKEKKLTSMLGALQVQVRQAQPEE
ncbi:MAG: hypothetical protein KDA68_23150 [Planctomycetaceae bacterium]|nr:hypothetical protein [Planctomycetaceae bacterium]